MSNATLSTKIAAVTRAHDMMAKAHAASEDAEYRAELGPYIVALWELLADLKREQAERHAQRPRVVY